ncbi:MAG: nicotinate-nucleotide--dimethylbenzimidazole phosphoribosyltransferase [Oscillospiraceae bacterium]|jgi:nicotinate-nucleotide--dimethylbenzimidazole phosphoribosyltransferase|nr:nicotinate-nucleotide--dimethylbenzimidazole phosphoribosyltransferase [Oscillospiraceae bacterium]
MDFTQLNAALPLPDFAAMKLAKHKWDDIAKPLGSLGLLEDAVVKIAGVSGDPNFSLKRRACAVFCADNGVVSEGISQSGQEVTMIVAQNLVKKQTSVCKMARAVNCDVFPVDAGMVTVPDFEGLISLRAGSGTANIAVGAAMNAVQVSAAVMYGIELASDLKSRGFSILATGEMGIGNTTTSAACAAVLLGKDAAEVAGRGAGLSNEGLERKIEVIRQAIEVNGFGGLVPDAIDAATALSVLQKLGGFDIAEMAGLFIGGARCGIPVIIDGFISSVAALFAALLAPKSLYYMLASHVSGETAGKAVLDELTRRFRIYSAGIAEPVLREPLGLAPPIHAEMRLGEGTGAVCLLPLLDMALCVYGGSSSFSEIGMENYTEL